MSWAGRNPIFFFNFLRVSDRDEAIGLDDCEHAESKHFQPMNVNFGIIKELEGPRIRDKQPKSKLTSQESITTLPPVATVVAKVAVPNT